MSRSVRVPMYVLVGEGVLTFITDTEIVAREVVTFIFRSLKIFLLKINHFLRLKVHPAR